MDHAQFVLAGLVTLERGMPIAKATMSSGDELASGFPLGAEVVSGPLIFYEYYSL